MSVQFDYVVTPETVPAEAGAVTLEVAVTNRTGADVPCKAIRLTLPEASFGSGVQATVDTTTWAVTGTDGDFTVDPQPPTTGLGTGQSIGLVFTGVEPAAPGPAVITVQEATSSVGETTRTVQVVSAELAITKFTASSLFVTPHAPVVFTWETVDADSVTLDWGEGSRDGDASGTWTVEPAATITAVLTAIKTGGGSVTADLTVTVQTPQILSLDNSPDPPDVPAGGPLLLAWETLYAQRCSLFFDKTGEEVDVPTTAGDYAVKPEIPGTYVLRAHGQGRTVPAQCDVDVIPVIAQFTATPVIMPGDVATLTWETEWATAVTITPDPGLGVLPLSGHAQVSPSEETVYTLVAAGYEPVTLTAPVAIYPAIGQVEVSAWGIDWLLEQNALTLGFGCAGAATASIDGEQVGANGGTATTRMALGSSVEHVLTCASAAGAVATCLVAVGVAESAWTEALVLTLSGIGSPINQPGGRSQVDWAPSGPALPDFPFPSPAWTVVLSDGSEIEGANGQIVAVAGDADPLWSGTITDTAGPYITVEFRVPANVPPSGGG